MTRRRRRLVAVAVVAGLVALALPPVHWRLYGWVRNEPFYRSRPASYWSAEIAACDATLFHACFTEAPTFKIMLARRPNSVDRVRQWLADSLNWPDFVPDGFLQFDDDDPKSLPVLLALLDEPVSKVRYFAVQSIAELHQTGRPALANLRAHVQDHAQVTPGYSVTVADAVSQVIHMLEANSSRTPDEAVRDVLHQLLLERGVIVKADSDEAGP